MSEQEQLTPILNRLVQIEQKNERLVEEIAQLNKRFTQFKRTVIIIAASYYVVSLLLGN